MLASILLGFALCGAQAEESPVVRVGIQQFREEGVYSERLRENDAVLQVLPELLKKQIRGYRFEFETMRASDLVREAGNGRFDIVFASSGVYTQLLPNGVYPVANLVTPRAPDPNQAEAGALIVRADRTDLNAIEDLQGKLAIAGKKSMYFAYQLPASAIVKKGFDPEKFFSRISYVDFPVYHVLEALYAGTVDVGFLRACVLEQLPEYLSRQFRVIEPVKNSPLKCAHTSELFPSWTVGAMPSAPSGLVRDIAVALFSEPISEQYGLKWGVANQFSRIDGLYRDLKIGRYAYLREWTLKGFLRKAWPFLLAAAIAVLSLVLHLARVQSLVDRRTAALVEEVHRRKDLEKRNAQVSLEYHRLERVSTMGQLSNMVAHELRQPISALHTFLSAMKRIARKESISSPLLEKALEGASQQTERINAIVDNVCSYYRQGGQKEPVELASLVEQTAAESDQIGLTAFPISLQLLSRDMVRANALEIRLVISNLIRNSVAAASPSDPRIAVRLSRQGERLELLFSDEAKALDDEQVERIAKNASEEKPNGLGLGLSIVKAIVTSHSGQIAFKARKPRGLAVVISLPVCEEKA